MRLGGSVGALGVGGGICGVGIRPFVRGTLVGGGVADRDCRSFEWRPVDAPADPVERTRPRMANASTPTNRTIVA